MIVDDDEHYLRAMYRRFEHEYPSVTVLGTQTLEEAESMLKNDPRVDSFVVDFWLEDGPATKLLPKIRKAKPNAVIVVNSSYRSAEMMRACIQLGADDVIDRAIRPDDLLVALTGAKLPPGLTVLNIGQRN